MLRSTESHAANDVTIPCRVRRSVFASKPKFEERPLEMICTMRVWHKDTPRRAPSSNRKSIVPIRNRSDESGAELVLTAAPVRAKSPLIRKRSPTSLAKEPPEEGEAEKPRSIAVLDILVADVYHKDSSNDDSKSERINLTTLSDGLFELTFFNRNALDVLLAFLQLWLPKERIMTPTPKNLPHEASCDCSLHSFDVEALTAHRMTEQLGNESLKDKVKRRMSRVVSSLEELSSALAECACSPCGVTEASWKRENGNEQREKAPPPPPCRRKKFDFRRYHLPSGLSVEPEPEMDTVSRASKMQQQ